MISEKKFTAEEIDERAQLLHAQGCIANCQLPLSEHSQWKRYAEANLRAEWEEKQGCKVCQGAGYTAKEGDTGLIIEICESCFDRVAIPLYFPTLTEEEES